MAPSPAQTASSQAITVPARTLLECAALVLLLLLTSSSPCSAQSVPSAFTSSATFWFAPNATATITTNSSLPTVLSWPCARSTLVLANASAPGPVMDRSLSPPSLAFSSSSALTMTQPLSTFFPSTLLLMVNVAQNCSYPACSLLSLVSKAHEGFLSISTAPSPYPGLWLTAIAIVTNTSTWSALSSIPLAYGSWQVLALSTGALSNGSLLTLRTGAGSETFAIALAVNDTLPTDLSTRVNFTVGDPALRGSVRDVVVVPSPLSPLADAGDSAFTYLYALYALSAPPARVLPANVTAWNSSSLIVQWAPPFSPTSAIISYQLRVITTSASTAAVASYIPTYNGLTAYQFTPAHRDNTTIFSIAVFASNLDFPNPPITTPLLYSAPVTLTSAPVAPISTIILSPPVATQFPTIWSVSALNITLLIAYQGNSSTTGPLSPLQPLQALSVFYSTDGGGNWTFVPLPVWNEPLTWANLQGTVANLQPNSFYVFKTMASNVAGAQNSSMSSAWYLQATGSPSTAAFSVGNATSSTSTSTSVPAPGTGSAGAGSPVQSSTSSSSNVSGGVAATSVTSGSSVSQLPAPPLTLASTLVSSSIANGSGNSTTAASTSGLGNNSASRSSSSSPSPSSSLSFSSLSPSSSRSVSSYSSSVSTTWATARPSAASGGGSSAPAGTLPVNDSSSTSDTLIAGVIIGVFVGLVLLGVLSYCCFCSSSARRKRQMPSSASGSSATLSTASTASSSASPRPSPELPPEPLDAPGDEKASRWTRHGRLDGRYASYDQDVELASVDAEWNNEESGVHQMRDLELSRPATVSTFRR